MVPFAAKCYACVQKTTREETLLSKVIPTSNWYILYFEIDQSNEIIVDRTSGSCSPHIFIVSFEGAII